MKENNFRVNVLRAITFTSKLLSSAFLFLFSVTLFVGRISSISTIYRRIVIIIVFFLLSIKRTALHLYYMFIITFFLSIRCQCNLFVIYNRLFAFQFYFDGSYYEAFFLYWLLSNTDRKHQIIFFAVLLANESMLLNTSL